MASAASYPNRWPTMADSTKASAESTDGTVSTAARGEPLVALGGHHDRRRLVRLVDGDLLGHVVGGAADQAGGAHQDQRLDDRSMCFLSSVMSQAIDL
jgi:hypothetical protein